MIAGSSLRRISAVVSRREALMFFIAWKRQNSQLVESSEDKVGGRCRIRTCDFHRVKVALYR
jgi:hypothetical protein